MGLGLQLCTGTGCTATTGAYGVSLTSPLPGEIVFNTTATGQNPATAVFQSVVWTTGSVTWNASDLDNGSQTMATFSGDTVTSFVLDFGGDNFAIYNTSVRGFTVDIALGCLNGEQSCTVSTSGLVAATTPLPAALSLFATGLGAMGLFGWRRKRKAQAVA